MSRSLDIPRLVQDIRAGNRRALARAITQIEDEREEGREILNALYPYSGKACLIGVTGAPGTGKSSLVNALTTHLRRLGKTVGIVAVDPSSPFTRGAILGDRIRMRDQSGDSGVFIRSMAARGNLGGLARTTRDVARAIDAAGFDFVFIETVGAGQNEVAIASAAQTTIVVEAPGLGDDIQAAKAGILEIADILVVNKADQSGANDTVKVLRAMLELGHKMQVVAHHGRVMLAADSHPLPEADSWRVPVIKTIATQGEGIPELYQAIEAHQTHLQQSGLGAERELARLEAELVDRLGAALLDRFLAVTPPSAIRGMIEEMAKRSLSPAEAVRLLLDGVNK